MVGSSDILSNVVALALSCGAVKSFLVRQADTPNGLSLRKDWANCKVLSHLRFSDLTFVFNTCSFSASSGRQSKPEIHGGGSGLG